MLVWSLYNLIKFHVISHGVPNLYTLLIALILISHTKLGHETELSNLYMNPSWSTREDKREASNVHRAKINSVIC
jgi:hypothetical protein